MKAKLLLVEDHDDTRNALATILRGRGYNVACAKSGTEAVKLATKSLFDLVLMDHGLPDGNGCGFMKTLHDVYKLEGIALTANAYESDERMSREAGFLAHLTKPIDTTKLCSAIEKVLSKKAES
jgi:CheY-like chemotaxis protein